MGMVLMVWAIASLFGVPIAVVFGWVYLKKRLGDMDAQIASLTKRLNEQERASSYLTPIAVRPEAEALVNPQHEGRLAEAACVPAAPVSLTVKPPSFVETPAEGVAVFSRAVHHRSTEEWETLLGGNWLNKVGVFVLVVGIALALGYSFSRVGPWGRISICVAVSRIQTCCGASPLHFSSDNPINPAAFRGSNQKLRRRISNHSNSSQ